MPIDVATVVSEINAILDVEEPLKGDDPEIYRLGTAACIERFSPPGSAYRTNLSDVRARTKGILSADGLGLLRAILYALRDDIAAGRLVSFTELIHADLFSDFLEGADYLLSEGWKDPSAVIIGSVLEEHLRKLAEKARIPVTEGGKPKKAERLNADLAGASVYSKNEQKSVTAWLGIRNDAAHGKYSNYTKEQVDLLLQGVRDFIARYPA